MALDAPIPYTEPPALTPYQIAKFWARMTILPTGCWEWSGHVGSSGYGSVTISHLYSGSTHRLAYLLTHGPIASGLYVMHSCDYRPCGNPAHLTLGTPLENMADAQRKGRIRRGDRHPSAILTEGQVTAIRNAYRERIRTMPELATDYGVTLGTIADLIKGRNWAHIPGAFATGEHWSKLTAAQVVEIRERFAADPDLPLVRLGEEYGCSPGLIKQILAGKIWRDLGGPLIDRDLRQRLVSPVWEQYDAIHADYAAGGVSMKALAQRHGTSVTTIHAILHTPPEERKRRPTTARW